MSTPAVLLTRDEQISDAVQAAAAALGVSVDAVTASDDCLARWQEAEAVLVGADQAAMLASAAPRGRPGVYLVGDDAAELGRWSVPLGGQVIVLPDGLAALTAVLADRHGSGAPIVGVVGGSGGVGASTLATALALVARRRSSAVALVDLDPWGGGLDLLLGAERTPGWRWADLVGARGEVTDIRRFLPRVEGLTVVSMGRPRPNEQPTEPPGPESLRAVLGSLARHHDLVLVDAGRAAAPCSRSALALCRTTLLVSGSSVRAVAAASAVARMLDGADLRLLVRPTAGYRVAAEVVGQALALPVTAVLPEVRGLGRAADDGAPPTGFGRRRWARALGRVLEALEVSRAG